MVDYNPDHKIDLKFMLAEQKERNPRAKFTRAKTLGYFYESQQIRKRIESYKYQMSHRPTARIIRTTAEKFQQSQGLTNWVTPHSVGRCHEVTEGTGDRWEDRENMKAASKALNELQLRSIINLWRITRNILLWRARRKPSTRAIFAMNLTSTTRLTKS